MEVKFVDDISVCCVKVYLLGVPSLNSLASVYNFQVSHTVMPNQFPIQFVIILIQDKPWVFAHLRDIQRELGKEKFPLINQQYFPDHKEMVKA